MDIQIKKDAAVPHDGDVVIMGHYQGTPLSPSLRTEDKKRGGAVQSALRSGEFDGQFLKTIWVRSASLPHLVVVGLGKRSEATPDRFRQTIGHAAKQARESRMKRVVIPIGKAEPIPVRMAVEGTLLALYQFHKYKSDLDKKRIDTILLTVDQKTPLSPIRKRVALGRCIAEGVNFVRDLCNTPSNEMTPTRLADEAKRIGAEPCCSVEILERDDMKRLGMGGLVGVARGTSEPPKFIVLEYNGRVKKSAPVVLVGKSVTFDSGGISLKPADQMEKMKYDMTGGATVLGVIQIVAAMKLPIRLIGILPATDNMPSGSAIHPGDVVKMLSGKTVEVINTDAEGRLCLADALSYAARYKPAVMIDLATLTGAATIALGQHAIALMGNNPILSAQMEEAGRKTGERTWELPLWDDYFNQIKGDIADLKNTGGRPAGTITAGLFLKQFVGKTPWIHLDIAGTSWNSDIPQPYIPKGATGVGVRLLVEFLSARALIS